MTQRFAVSIKGVCLQKGKVLLLRNERGEWELPGGKLERDEDPQACVVREIEEETGWRVTPVSILDAWQYHIRDGFTVLIVTYGCRVNTDAVARVSHEHAEVRLFGVDEIDGLDMPHRYQRSIHDWFAGCTEAIDE